MNNEFAYFEADIITDEEDEVVEAEINTNVEIQSEKDFNKLDNKPQINGVTLEGNKTPKDLLMSTSQLNNDGDGTSSFATEEYVQQNGGKIDSISIDGIKQEIDENKNIDIDLKDYVKNTDYATSTKGGVVKVSSSNGLQMYEGSLTTNYATKEDMNYQANTWKPVTPKFLAYGVKRALIEPEKSPTPANWTEEEKASVRNLIKAVGKEDYASVDNAGVIKPNTSYGTYVNQDTGVLSLVSATDSVIKAKTDNYRPIVSKNLDIAVKTGVTTNTIELTEEEKIAAQNWLGATNEKYVDEQITGVIEIAEGKTKSFTVDTLSDLGTLLGIDASVVADEYVITNTTITYKEQSIELKQGDLFLIVDTNVPDYWVSVDDMKLYKMETTKVDLTEYVKFTNYASAGKGGVVKVSSGYGSQQIAGFIAPVRATDEEIDAKTQLYTPIVPANLDHAIKVGLTTNQEEWSDEDKANARTLIDAVKLDTEKHTWLAGKNTLYATNYDGDGIPTQATMYVVSVPTSGRIPMWTGTKTLRTETPVNDLDAANKKYVDDIAATIPTFTATQLEDGSYSLTIGG